MVDINKLGSIENNLFANLDSKITIRLIKEKRTSRSYVEGLTDFMNAEQIEAFRGKLKKSLGTGSSEKTIKENNKTNIVYGFNGDHRETIKNILIQAGIDEEKITVKA